MSWRNLKGWSPRWVGALFVLPGVFIMLLARRWIVAALVTASWLILSSCASLDSYAAAHPDVVAKAQVAIELAQCADDAVEKYRAAEVARVVPDAAPPEPVHELEPNPYVTDGGTP